MSAHASAPLVAAGERNPAEPVKPGGVGPVHPRQNYETQ